MSADPRQFDTAQSGDGSSADWQARAADTVESLVGALHNKVIRPLLIVARALVFGILIAACALVVVVVVSVALVRFLNVYAFSGRTWASEAVVGIVLTALGLVAWTLRNSRSSAEGG